MANSFSFGGTDLSTFGVTVTEGNLSILPDPKIETVEISRGHGGYSSGTKLRSRRLVLPVGIVGDNFADLLSKLDSIRAVLAPSRGDQQIILDYQSTRYYLGRLESGITTPPAGTKGLLTELVFICADPLAYATTETVLTYTEGGGWDGTVDYTGNVETPLVIVADPDGGAVSPPLTVENETSGEIVSASYALGEGNKMRFDGVREILEVYPDAEDEWFQVQRYLSETERAFPMLYPGDNSLIFSGLANSGGSDFSWTVTYRARFL